jgi:small-conductance mechanosensitive channel
MLIEDINKIKNEAKEKINQLKYREKQSNILLKTLQKFDKETIKIAMQKYKKLQQNTEKKQEI